MDTVPKAYPAHIEYGSGVFWIQYQCRLLPFLSVCEDIKSHIHQTQVCTGGISQLLSRRGKYSWTFNTFTQMPTSGREKGWMLSCKKIVLHILMLDFSTNAIITQSSSLSCLVREEVGKTSQLRLQLIACSLFFEEKEKWKVLIKQLVCSIFYPGWSEISQICKIICFEVRIELPFFILKWGCGGERFQVNWQWPCKAPPNKCNKRRIFFHFASPKKWVLQIKFNPAMFDRVNFYFLFPNNWCNIYVYCKFQRAGTLKSFPSEWTFQFVEIEA